MGVYQFGEGVPQDHREAAKWVRMAADQGQAMAQDWLARMYLRGEGVTKDREEAAKWFRKAAEQGFADAQLYLGMMYFIGEGVVHDFVQAHAWFNLAASQGNDKGKENRDDAAKQMTPTQIAKHRN